jgi:xylulokinase
LTTAFLGIDIGTSSTKALLMAADTGDVLAVASAEYPIHNPQPDYAEQNPSDWWQATIQTVREVVSRTDADIAGIGLSGQMHGTVLLDNTQTPLHPAIIWADGRTAGTVQTMETLLPLETSIPITGTRPAAGFTGITLVWLRQNQPQLLESAAHVLLPKDYVRLKLTGQLATDITDAAGTALFNVQRQQWSDEVIDAYQLPRDLFPQVLASYEVAGRLTSEAADALGLSAGVPVVAGCADQPAQAFGNGITRPGLASITIGSGGQVFMPLSNEDDVQTDERLHVFCHATGDLYALGATLSAGLSLRWLRDIAASDTDEAFDVFSQAASDVAAGSEGLLFLPYLNGERTPHMNAQARGGFIGLRLAHTRGHLARAIMEGVAFSLRQAYEICLTTGADPQELVISGGGADSAVWRQILTDVTGEPLVKSLRDEQAALGAATLAAVGTQYYSDTVVEGINTARDIIAQYDEPTTPNPQHTTFYNERYEHFKTFYPRLKDDFQRLSAHSPDDTGKKSVTN